MPDCDHTQTELMMRRDGIDYVRCLGCDQVFEADDLQPTSAKTDDDAEDAEVLRIQHRHRKAS